MGKAGFASRPAGFQSRPLSHLPGVPTGARRFDPTEHCRILRGTSVGRILKCLQVLEPCGCRHYCLKGRDGPHDHQLGLTGSVRRLKGALLARAAPWAHLG